MSPLNAALATALAHHQSGRLAEAEQIYRQVLAVAPNPIVYSNLGNVLVLQGKLPEAVETYQRALAIEPHSPESCTNLAYALSKLHRHAEAVPFYERALHLKPNDPVTHYNLGNAFREQVKLDEAIDCYRRALALHPAYADAANNLGMALKDQGKVDEAIACFRRAIELNPNLPAAQSNLLYTIWFSARCDLAQIFQEHQQWYAQSVKPLIARIPPHTNSATLQRRLRIGYVSPYFRRHVLAVISFPLFSAHNHREFEIFCYSDVVQPDAATIRFRSYADVWRDVAELSDDQLAQVIRVDQIDILIDLTMHMANGRPLLFARKPAPIQACWFAYPGGTGLETMDYRLTDPYLDPPGFHNQTAVNDQYYSERSYRLPDCFWCYSPIAPGLTVNALPAVSNGFVTFGCLNNFYKVNEAVLKLWARVLNAAEHSRLLLLAPPGSCRENVLRIFGQGGITADRVTFVSLQPRLSYFQLYNQIDIAVDTFPVNGHTTSLDAFWMGVPVVTLVGDTPIARAGYCQLSNLGLPELAAATPEEFIAICAGLAKDLVALGQLRATLRDRIEKSPLMDANRFARNMEAAYRFMWRQRCLSAK